MAEPSISEKIASFNQKAQEDFLKVIDVIMEVGKRAYEKESEALKPKEKDCSDSIELQSHLVKFGFYHTSIRITPKGEEFKNDPRFKQVDEAGRHYTTLGAGPVYNRLTADVDRPNDIGPHPYRIPIGLKNCENESMLIEHVLDKLRKFRSNTDYDLFPENTHNQAWYWADDGHNSNSFISGLIDASHLDKPSIDVAVHPGWNKPIHKKYFSAIQDDYYGLMMGANEYEEQSVFGDLYRKDNGNRSEDILEKLQRRYKEEIDPDGIRFKPYSHYDAYKKRMADEKYWKEAVERHHECSKSGGGEICLQFLEPRDVYESKRSEVIKEVFNKIDEFKKSDTFKFAEQQVEGFKKILPKF
jgi:hypothetical protein